MYVQLIRIVIAAVVLTVVHDARAQSTGSAEALFRDGRQLMTEGKIGEACTAFEGSERLEHNIATIMNLADCREKEGRLATAWALFLQVESQTRTAPAQAALNAAAKKHALLLEANLSYLTINVHDHTSELAITRDGKPVDSAEWSVPIPVDSGSHTITLAAPHRVPWSMKVEIGIVDKKTIDLPTLVVQIEPPVARPVALPGMFSIQREVSVGVAAGALVVAGVSIFLGVSSHGLRDDALARCPPNSCSASDATAAQSLDDRARDRAFAANVGFGLAGAAVLGGVALWIWGAPATPSRVELTPTTNGFAFGGAF